MRIDGYGDGFVACLVLGGGVGMLMCDGEGGGGLLRVARWRRGLAASRGRGVPPTRPGTDRRRAQLQAHFASCRAPSIGVEIVKI